LLDNVHRLFVVFIPDLPLGLLNADGFATNKEKRELIKADGIHRSVLRAALSVGAAGIFVKLVATAKEIGVASVYGRSDAWMPFSRCAHSQPARQPHFRIHEPGSRATLVR